MSQSSLSIVVSGTFSAVPGHGGWTWVILQYVLGLRRLGHHVFLVDPISSASLQPPSTRLADSRNALYFREVIERFDLEPIAALVHVDEPRATLGLSDTDVRRVLGQSDLLINISGVLKDESLLGEARRRVYLDLDPGFTQLWHTVEGVDMGFANHTDFVTIGPRIGEPDCPVPTCGLSWIPTWQPIVLDQWPVMTTVTRAALTTVANWRGYGSITYRGVVYGQKAHAFRSLMALPTLTPECFELALAIDPGETVDVRALADSHWLVVDPLAVARTPDEFRRFVQSSKGEFGVAKTGYVHSRCGWFSDRSVCYLASGRPVVAQETGFSALLPTGQGLLPFTTTDDAIAAIDQLNADYPRHARAARSLAETFFDSDKVLSRLLDRLGA